MISIEKMSGGEFQEFIFINLGGPKKDWKCSLCIINLANGKWIYKDGKMGTGCKLFCNDCSGLMKHIILFRLRNYC